MPSPERLRQLAEAQEPRAGMVLPFFLVPGAGGVTEVLLIRHGQVPESATFEDQGLTPLGLQQAQVLAEYLDAVPIDALYASPTLRARQTAEAIALRRGLDVSVVDGLRDVDNRLPPGLSFREALEKTFGAEEAARRFARLQQGLNFDVFGDLMESSASLRHRVAGAVDTMIAEHSGGRVALVSHGPPIAAYVSHILDSPTDFVFYPRLTSITTVLARDDRRQLHVLNATPHFHVL